MNSLKKLYRDFFGLNEAVGKIETEDPKQAEEMAKKGMTVKLVKPGMTTEDLDPVGQEDDDIDNDGKKNTKTDRYLKNRRNVRKKAIKEIDIDEAQLVNNITDYKGGIEYVLRDPATAQQTAQEIQEWAERKGFTIIKKMISPTKKIGYFYFRLGQDPALGSQKLQGYLAQKPELKHFRFNVRNQPKQPQGKI